MTYQPFYYPPPPPFSAGQTSACFQSPDGLFTATGPIYPSRFVTIDGSDAVKQSAEGDWPIGVSQPNTAIWSQPFAATAGYQLQTFGMGRECWLELGGDVAEGDSIRADSQGRGIVSCGVHQSIAAVARQSGESGQLIRVLVLRRQPITQNCGFSEFDYEFSYEFGVPCECP